MTDQPPAGPIVPDLSIPFDRAIVEIIAKPPFDRAGATAAEAGGLIIRQLTTDALAASGLGGPTRDHVISAQETAIGFACWGAVRFAAELAEDGSTTQPADLLTSFLDQISAGYEAAEVTAMVEAGLAIFHAMRQDPKIEGLCDAIQNLFVWYARTGDPVYVTLGATTLKGLAEARRRPPPIA